MYIMKRIKKKITTPLSDEALNIIKKYGVCNSGEDDYLLPVLDKKIHKTEIQKQNRIHKV